MVSYVALDITNKPLGNFLVLRSDEDADVIVVQVPPDRTPAGKEGGLEEVAGFIDGPPLKGPVLEEVTQRLVDMGR